MAERGGQPGNQNAVKAKRWQQAIDRALARRSKASGIEELDRLADVYLQAAEDMVSSPKPSIAGLADLADRMDGKPAQTITGDNGDPLFQITDIRVTVVDPK